ncbi:hypothetical protein [Geobacter sp. AOG2]|uniref:hypothetical protein n=1 Tax=Geobacter sp. AOG2 TaxID=1566347 RepID=UPI001CC4749D|nr:hypothetical protein [Geobacter sp. AOG2]GFE62430.1 hypothetical protein AOG2_30180 [Geobacter sp. AOG2]
MLAKKKDESVFGMLRSERDRCLLVMDKINRELDKLPKGSLGERKVRSHGKEYVYPCLRYRGKSGVVFEHLSPAKAKEIKPELEKRKRLQADLKANKKRIATLNAILHKG